jgi:hypothetical protein
MQVVRSGTKRKTVNKLGFVGIESLYATRAVRNNAPSLHFWWLAYRQLCGNYRCHALWSVVFMHGNEPARCETELRAIVYSVHIGPPQPKVSFIAAASHYHATIRIDNSLGLVLEIKIPTIPQVQSQ